MRKEAGFEVMNHINVFQDGNDKLAEILKKHTEEIKKEVLADNILIGTMSGYTKEWDINGEKGMFGVEEKVRLSIRVSLSSERYRTSRPVRTVVVPVR